MSWPMVKLGDVSERVDYGLTASAIEKSDGPRFLRITDLQNDSVEWDEVPSCDCTPKEFEANKLAVGDIVFARTGATTGKSFLIRSLPKPSVFASYLIRVRPDASVDSGYLSHFFKSPIYWNQITNMANGAAQPGVNSSKLKELEIPLPPLAEQKRIAAIMDKADAIRRKRQQAIQLADDFLRAVFLEMFGDPVTNPKGWEVLELHQVVDFIGGSTLPSTEEYIGQNKGIAAFKVGDMNSDGNDTFLITPREWAKEYSRRHAYAPRGTIVIPKRGGAISTNKKRITSIESVLDPNLMGILPKNKVSLEYLFYWFQMLDLSSISNGSSVPQLNKKDLAPLNILVADNDVHVKFDEIYRNVQAIKLKLISSLHLNELSFSGLSQKAFSGQL